MYLKVIYCKYINANMYHIAAAVFEKFLFLRIGLEDTVTNVETSITKRFIWIINVYICKDIYRLNVVGKL